MMADGEDDFDVHGVDGVNDPDVDPSDQLDGGVDAFANVGQGLVGEHKTAMLNYWQQAIDDIERIAEDGKSQDTFKSTVLPLARIKKVMKTDSEVRMISAEAPILFAKGCDIFITELTMRAWIHAEENKRRTLQRSDIATALQKSDVFDFLIDIVPREEAQPRRPHRIHDQGPPKMYGMPQDLPQNMSQNMAHTMPPQGLAQGIPQGMPQGMQGMPQGMPQGMSQGIAQGMPSLPQNLPQGMPQGLPASMQGMQQLDSQALQSLRPGLPQGIPQSMQQNMGQAGGQGMMGREMQGIRQSMQHQQSQQQQLQPQLPHQYQNQQDQQQPQLGALGGVGPSLNMNGVGVQYDGYQGQPQYGQPTDSSGYQGQYPNQPIPGRNQHHDASSRSAPGDAMNVNAMGNGMAGSMEYGGAMFDQQGPGGAGTEDASMSGRPSQGGAQRDDSSSAAEAAGSAPRGSGSPNSPFDEVSVKQESPFGQKDGPDQARFASGDLQFSNYGADAVDVSAFGQSF